MDRAARDRAGHRSRHLRRPAPVERGPDLVAAFVSGRETSRSDRRRISLVGQARPPGHHRGLEGLVPSVSGRIPGCPTRHPGSGIEFAQVGRSHRGCPEQGGVHRRGGAVETRRPHPVGLSSRMDHAGRRRRAILGRGRGPRPTRVARHPSRPSDHHALPEWRPGLGERVRAGAIGLLDPQLLSGLVGLGERRRNAGASRFESKPAELRDASELQTDEPKSS